MNGNGSYRKESIDHKDVDGAKGPFNHRGQKKGSNAAKGIGKSKYFSCVLPGAIEGETGKVMSCNHPMEQIHRKTK